MIKPLPEGNFKITEKTTFDIPNNEKKVTLNPGKYYTHMRNEGTYQTIELEMLENYYGTDFDPSKVFYAPKVERVGGELK